MFQHKNSIYNVEQKKEATTIKNQITLKVRLKKHNQYGHTLFYKFKVIKILCCLIFILFAVINLEIRELHNWKKREISSKVENRVCGRQPAFSVAHMLCISSLDFAKHF